MKLELTQDEILNVTGSLLILSKIGKEETIKEPGVLKDLADKITGQLIENLKEVHRK